MIVIIEIVAKNPVITPNTHSFIKFNEIANSQYRKLNHHKSTIIKRYTINPSIKDKLLEIAPLDNEIAKIYLYLFYLNEIMLQLLFTSDKTIVFF